MYLYSFIILAALEFHTFGHFLLSFLLNQTIFLWSLKFPIWANTRSRLLHNQLISWCRFASTMGVLKWTCRLYTSVNGLTKSKFWTFFTIIMFFLFLWTLELCTLLLLNSFHSPIFCPIKGFFKVYASY